MRGHEEGRTPIHGLRHSLFRAKAVLELDVPLRHDLSSVRTHGRISRAVDQTAIVSAPVCVDKRVTPCVNRLYTVSEGAQLVGFNLHGATLALLGRRVVETFEVRHFAGT